MKTVLVTGGAGFIGGNLCRAMLGDPDIGEVRVIDDLSTGSRSVVDSIDATFFEASINDSKILAEAAEGVDTIVHLAALGSVPRSVTNPIASHEANATGTLKVLLAAKDNDAHVILASSSSVYGANQVIPKIETLQCMPMSPYAVTKLAAEQYAMAFAQCYDLKVLPFRFFNVFGPGQLPGHAYAAVIPVFLEAAIAGRALPINGNGMQSRDFTYVGTLVDVIVSAVKNQTVSSPVNLAFGTRTSLLELIEVMAAIMGRELKGEHRAEREGDVFASQADNTLLRSLFPGVEPVSLHQGLAETYAWMKQHMAH